MRSGLVDRTADSNSAGRRRFWSCDEKRRLVAESFAPGASVSKVALHYGVNANLLFTWQRRDTRTAASAGVEAVELLTVRVEDERAVAAPVAAPGPVGRMEIVLAAGERIVVGPGVNGAALARVVKALSRR
jgi:transposase